MPVTINRKRRTPKFSVKKGGRISGRCISVRCSIGTSTGSLAERQARQEMIRQSRRYSRRGRFRTDIGDEFRCQSETREKALEAQRQQILANLRSLPPNGRLVINITSDISRWENSSRDVVLRPGDTLYIPKRPEFVMASGQVYNPVAISYVPGKRLGWYFHKAGGSTPQGNKKDVYVFAPMGRLCHGGSAGSVATLWVLQMRPGDTIFVPERIVARISSLAKHRGHGEVMAAITLPLALSGVI